MAIKQNYALLQPDPAQIAPGPVAQFEVNRHDWDSIQHEQFPEIQV
jgi:hypothetical protein